jgi:membrane protease subunit (stomatin/prohibitin family)
MSEYAALGLQLRAFQVAAITPPEEVQKFIDQRSSMGALGNMQQYMQFQTAQAVRDAANNPGEAGGAQGMGLGLGMGMAMADQVRQSMQPQQGQYPPQQGNQQPQGQAPQAPQGGQGAAPGAGPKFCPECGTATSGAKFCSNCGHKLIP